MDRLNHGFESTTFPCIAHKSELSFTGNMNDTHNSSRVARCRAHSKISNLFHFTGRHLIWVKLLKGV